MALHPTFSKYSAGYWFSRANRSATAVAPNRGSTGSDTRLISPGRAVIRSLRNERRSLGIEVQLLVGRDGVGDQIADNGPLGQRRDRCAGGGQPRGARVLYDSVNQRHARM